MHFYNFLVLQIVVALLTSAIVGVWNKSILWGFISLALILIPCPLIALLLKKYKKLKELKKSGIVGYYEKFDSKMDCNIFSNETQVKESFCYFGASSNSFLEHFKKWMTYNPTISSYRFLLIDPGSEGLINQIAFENNLSNSLLDHNIIEAEKKRIISAIEVLKNSRPFKEKKMEIRLYSGFIPCWFYLIDDRMIYLGILKNGKRGEESVILTEKLNDTSTLFDVYKNTWNCIWSNSTKVS